MKAIKWLVVALSIFIISCEQPVDDNCYSDANQERMCGYIRGDMERAWDKCYDGNDSEQDITMLRAIDIIHNWCLQTECLSKDVGLECAKDAWKCAEFDGKQDLQIPWSCKEAIDEL